MCPFLAQTDGQALLWAELEGAGVGLRTAGGGSSKPHSRIGHLSLLCRSSGLRCTQ